VAGPIFERGHALRWLFDFLFSAVAIWLLGASTCDARPEPQSNYIRNQGSERVIIFVHGFGGNSIDTWTNGSSYWPEMISNDHDFDGADIFVYQYPTSITESMTPDEVAGDMRSVLTAQRVSNRRQIVFIAHSMGGVVTRDYLLGNPDVAKRTSFIEFLSTPTDGSSLAFLGRVVNSPQIMKLTTDIQKDYLGDLSRQWSSENLARIPSYCAYETRDTLFYGRVVSMESATHLCTRHISAVDANHFEIAKPKDSNSPPYTTFKESYLEAFERSKPQAEQTAEALIINRNGGTIDSLIVDHNVVVGAPVILDNAGHIGPSRVEDNWVGPRPPKTKCRGQRGELSGQPALAATEEAPDHKSPSHLGNVVISFSTFIGVSDLFGSSTDSGGSRIIDNSYFRERHDAVPPFRISSQQVIRNYDGTVIRMLSAQVDKEAKCDYFIIALRGDSLINFWVTDGHRVIGVDQVPLAGFEITKIVNPSGEFTVLMRQKAAPTGVDMKVWWK
jgi:pimeloyl-ACP methyl ester carboxylesterase